MLLDLNELLSLDGYFVSDQVKLALYLFDVEVHLSILLIEHSPELVQYLSKYPIDSWKAPETLADLSQIFDSFKEILFVHDLLVDGIIWHLSIDFVHLGLE